MTVGLVLPFIIIDYCLNVRTLLLVLIFLSEKVYREEIDINKGNRQLLVGRRKELVGPLREITRRDFTTRFETHLFYINFFK